jgi:hypothetical protein
MVLLMLVMIILFGVVPVIRTGRQELDGFVQILLLVAAS